MRFPALLIPVAFLIALQGCSQPLTQIPSPIAGWTRAPVCSPIGVEIHCLVDWADNPPTDATESVTWIVGDSWLPRYARSSIAVVAAPGRIVPVGRGNIAVHIPVPGPIYDVAAPHTYAVDPTAPPIALAPFLSGYVTETDGTTRIADVRVEILGGPDAGKFALTIHQTSGSAYLLEHLRMGVPFTVRASKSGYLPSTATFPGFFDDASGVPTSDIGTSLKFSLQRVSS